MHQGKFVNYEYDGKGNLIGKIAGVKQQLMKEQLNQGKVEKKQSEIIYNAAKNDSGGKGNSGGNGNGNGSDNGKGMIRTPRWG
jgi:hypothetical protein